MIAWLFFLPFGYLAYRRISNGDDNGWWWVAAGFVVMGLAMGGVQTGGGNCYTEWDGRSNRTVCK